ncbi:hypothetical protein COBT_000931, partial [Conglomerata obtusa]
MVEIASTDSIQSEVFDECYTKVKGVYIKKTFDILICKTDYMRRRLKKNLPEDSNSGESEFYTSTTSNTTISSITTNDTKNGSTSIEVELEEKKLHFAQHFQKIDATIKKFF